MKKRYSGFKISCLWVWLLLSSIPVAAVHAAPLNPVFLSEGLEWSSEDRALQDRITGRVVNNAGEPLAGITIYLKSKPDLQYSTDENGQFSIPIISGQDVLVAQAIGFVAQEVPVEGDDQALVITMESSMSALEQVIVVGYGTQKRKDVVGAISQISGESIEDRPTTNIVKSIQGAIPGVTVTMRDGKPSRGSVPSIRGAATSIGSGGAALVLIDGVEGNLSTVNPDDVESISVLKDASSAAVYGARGAFGVILVTTKDPKQGATRIQYNGDFSVNRRTVMWEDQIITEPVQWTDRWYDAYQGAYDYATEPNGINNVPYSKAWHEELLRVSANPDLYKYRVVNGRYEYFGNTNWLDLFYKDENYTQSHSLSMQGADENSSYFISGRFYDQDGIYKVGNEAYKQYNLRAKGTIQLKPWLSIENNTSFFKRRHHQPMLHYNRQLVQRQIEHEGHPITLVTNPDGSWTRAAVITGYAGFAEGTSWQSNDKLDLINTTTLNLDLIKDVLTVKGDFTYKGIRSDRRRLENMYDFKNGPNITSHHNTYSSYQVVDYTTDYLSANATATYTPDLGDKHDFTGLLGWNIEDNHYEAVNTYRRGVLYPRLPSLTLMDGDYYTTTSDGNSWGFVGVFFRANYSYDGRYLVELSGRYDGSSKFPSDKRFGFFPSASLGWVLSNESFMENTLDVVSNLKLRGSIGSLGNGQIAPYSYLPTMDIDKTSVLIDGTTQSYTGVPNLIPSGLTWETVSTYNIGLDADFFSNRLNFIGDYYVRNTTDMFTVGPNLPQVLGTLAPYGNNADLQTKGWELSLGWNDQFDLKGKPFNYSFKAMLWDSKTWITKYFNEDGDITTYYEGMEVGDIWGFRVAGLFASDEEAAYWADQSFFNSSSSRQVLAGDLKFHDLNGDGKVNRGNETLDNPGDMEVIGNSSPRYQFGFMASANWNNFGLSVFLQGVGKKQWYPYPESDFFWGMYGRPYGYLMKEHVGGNVWTPDNPNPDAYWPRLRGYAANRTVGPMSLPNDRYLQDVSYLRIKNLTLNYSLPKTLVKRMGLEDLKITLAGENLFAFSNLFKYTKSFDPEVINAGDTDFRSTRGVNNDGQGYSYPMLKSYSVGLNIIF